MANLVPHLGPGSHWVTSGSSLQHMWVCSRRNIRHPPCLMWQRNESRRLFLLWHFWSVSLFHPYLFYSQQRKSYPIFFFFWPRSTQPPWQTWYDPTYEPSSINQLSSPVHHFSSSLTPFWVHSHLSLIWKVRGLDLRNRRPNPLPLAVVCPEQITL